MSNKRKVTVLLLSLATVIISIFFYFSSRLYWKYDDQWIIGKTEKEIVERYGKFDYNSSEGVFKGYFIGQEGQYQQSDKYYILEFNNNKVTRVFIRKNPDKT